jgi:hypothetical protein
MAIVALTSAKGAPGVTVASLALTLCWSRSVVLAECDPSGGSVMAGYLAGQIPAGPGLTRLAVADRHGQLAQEFGAQLIELATDRDGHRRLLLPGIADPAQGAILAPVWESLAGFLAQLRTATPPCDVIVDCGRMPALHAPLPLLYRADAVLLTVGRTMDAISAAIPRVTLLRRGLEDNGGGVLRLLVTGRGEYPAKDIARHLDTPLLAQLPDDPKSAAALSTGAAKPNPKGELLRAVRSAQATLRELLAVRAAAVAGTGSVAGAAVSPETAHA